MSRFGFKTKRCEAIDDKSGLECIAKVYIDNQSCVFWTDKATHSNVFIHNLTKDRWYKMFYDEFHRMCGI